MFTSCPNAFKTKLDAKESSHKQKSKLPFTTTPIPESTKSDHHSSSTADSSISSEKTSATSKSWGQNTPPMIGARLHRAKRSLKKPENDKTFTVKGEMTLSSTVPTSEQETVTVDFKAVVSSTNNIPTNSIFSLSSDTGHYGSTYGYSNRSLKFQQMSFSHDIMNNGVCG